MFAGNVVAGELAKSELVSIVTDLGKAELAPDFFKVGVIGMGQRFV